MAGWGVSASLSSSQQSSASNGEGGASNIGGNVNFGGGNTGSMLSTFYEPGTGLTVEGMLALGVVGVIIVALITRKN